jgi:hypothetical protein
MPIYGPLDASGTRLREAAEIIADRARELSSRSRRIPGSVRVYGDRRVMTIAAGGTRAPQAYTFENPRGGAGVWHPVYGHGPRSTWHWVRQTPRPFLLPAVDETADRAVNAWGEAVISDWAQENGFR